MEAPASQDGGQWAEIALPDLDLAESTRQARTVDLRKSNKIQQSHALSGILSVGEHLP
jgi:hypothetical protein